MRYIKYVYAVVVALLLVTMLSATVYVSVSPAQPTVLSGDDNHDGVIDEDESGWNCKIDGNKICGLSKQ